MFFVSVFASFTGTYEDSETHLSPSLDTNIVLVPCTQFPGVLKKNGEGGEVFPKFIRLILSAQVTVLVRFLNPLCLRGCSLK